jgi:hypothetical protein
MDGLRMLVVHDDVTACELLRRVFAGMGVEVVVAHTVAEGLTRLGTAPISSSSTSPCPTATAGSSWTTFVGPACRPGWPSPRGGAYRARGVPTWSCASRSTPTP